MLKMAWKLIVLIIGLTIILIGLIMLVTPGPAIIVIPIGLAVLASEFVWAKRILNKLKEEGKKMRSSVFHTNSDRS